MTLFDRKFSLGERRLLLASLLGAVFGLILSWAALQTLSWRVDVDQSEWTRQESWLVLTGTAVVGGLVLFMRKHFGHSGAFGVVRTLVAGLWILFLAGVITGTLNMPLWGTTFGVIIIAGTLVKSPLLAALSLGVLALVHWLCSPWQDERNSALGYSETEH